MGAIDTSPFYYIHAPEICVVYMTPSTTLPSLPHQLLHPALLRPRAYLNPKAKAFAKSFALLGTERMAPPEACFPSDHFGMDCSFEW